MTETLQNAHQFQIRAHYDEQIITLYLAFCSEIADAAIAEQRLDASSLFKRTRMTWVKPSWCWMMYRSFYSTRDKFQERILAVTIPHDHFHNLLKEAVVVRGQKLNDTDKSKNVRVQWDPERGPRLEILPYRSIQIGLQGLALEEFVRHTVMINDVTGKALELKTILGVKEETKGGLQQGSDIQRSELEQLGVWPKETPYIVPDHLKSILGIDDG